jgi:glycine dehydrogenase
MKHPFSRRHLGIGPNHLPEMLEQFDQSSLDGLMEKVIPDNIKRESPLQVPKAMTEYEFLKHMRAMADKNKLFRSYIGQGYYGTIVPSVIQRNIFENPGWYTQYTPYQAEISQGRLEALLNFQTVIADLTAMPLANASLLDEATAAAEAMTMLYSIRNKKQKKDPITKFFVDRKVFAQTTQVLFTRAEPLDIEVVVGDWKTFEPSEEYFGALVQFPDADGEVHEYQSWIESCKEQQMLIAVAADLMSLTILTPPGEWGADVVVGTSQRFGVPMGAGGPHAAFFATHEAYKRQIPGRIIGVSVDRNGHRALRMALQTREQHIKRDRATSNICTAQALLAIMSGMYAVFHGPEGLEEIAEDIHTKTVRLKKALEQAGQKVLTENTFDTLTLELEEGDKAKLRALAEQSRINFWYYDGGIKMSLDETTMESDLHHIWSVFQKALSLEGELPAKNEVDASPQMRRTSSYLEHEVFHLYRSETEVMRYIKRLERKDLSLTHSMISLGSCTMKLNAATQLIPLSWPNFAHIHPFAPIEQREGYMQIINALADYLVDITGFKACSFQPNSGAQGEYAGLLTIRSYHKAHGNHQRNIALIPDSAHGTNPASAVMAGMKVVVVKCDDKGNIDLDDLRAKAQKHSENLAAMMVTYPSTHGVFETEIKEICELVHQHGGLMYMDGANMNAQVGYTSPGHIDADVCHLNLHKTFAIPHGGGGPGMGPICVNEKLAPFLPGHVYDQQHSLDNGSVAAAPYGSPSILLISYAYIRLLGPEGLKNATSTAILNANYIKKALEEDYSILYTGPNGFCAHEFIVDLRPFKSVGIGAEDVAKRLIDYGFHAPTMSFPVPGTIMIEPTESESKEELDRFIEALKSIKQEIDQVAEGALPEDNNPLVNAPHPIQEITANEWSYPYEREQAAYPLPYLKEGYKFWVTVGRVDNAYGDRNLVCTCPPMELYADENEEG